MRRTETRKAGAPSMIVLHGGANQDSPVTTMEEALARIEYLEKTVAYKDEWISELFNKMSALNKEGDLLSRRVELLKQYLVKLGYKEI